MGNIDTVRAITLNLRSALRGEGIKFSTATYKDDKSIPVALIPFGSVYYEGEGFEYTHGERMGYAEAAFRVRVLLRERDPSSMVPLQQKWIHRIRSAVTVTKLNAGALQLSKLVTGVTIKSISIDNKPGISKLSADVTVRYRETN